MSKYKTWRYTFYYNTLLLLLSFIILKYVYNYFSFEAFPLRSTASFWLLCRGHRGIHWRRLTSLTNKIMFITTVNSFPESCKSQNTFCLMQFIKCINSDLIIYKKHFLHQIYQWSITHSPYYTVSTIFIDKKICCTLRCGHLHTSFLTVFKSRLICFPSLKHYRGPIHPPL